MLVVSSPGGVVLGPVVVEAGSPPPVTVVVTETAALPEQAPINKRSTANRLIGTKIDRSIPKIRVDQHATAL